MANSNFVVKNGLEVGALTIFAANGGIATTGAISTSGGFGGVDSTAIINGTTNVQAYENGNVSVSAGGESNVAVFADNGLHLGAGNYLYGQATSAQYADLAEKYTADAELEPGTVVHFGGEAEVSQCDVDHCTAVAGVVSTAPAYRMNDGLEAEHVAMVALTGRVPTKVTGPVHKGDMMVSAGNGMARAEANPKVGAVIGKALENWEGGEGVIEVVIGK